MMPSAQYVNLMLYARGVARVRMVASLGCAGSKGGEGGRKAHGSSRGGPRTQPSRTATFQQGVSMYAYGTASTSAVL